MMKRDASAQDELQSVAPFLASLPKKESDLLVSAGYFEALPDTVWREIIREEQGVPIAEKGRVMWLHSFGLLRVAAVLLIVGTSVWLWRGSQQPAIELADFSEVATNDLMAYVENNLSDFDEDLISEGYSGSSVSAGFSGEDASSGVLDAQESTRIGVDSSERILTSDPTDEELEILLEDMDEEDFL